MELKYSPTNYLIKCYTGFDKGHKVFTSPEIVYNFIGDTHFPGFAPIFVHLNNGKHKLKFCYLCSAWVS